MYIDACWICYESLSTIYDGHDSLIMRTGVGKISHRDLLSNHYREWRA